jgi:hypothetical protein
MSGFPMKALYAIVLLVITLGFAKELDEAAGRHLGGDIMLRQFAA